MDTVKRIAKNTSLLLVSKIIGYIFAFLYIIYIARYLGTEGFGILSFALAFTSIFSFLADLGLNTLIVREIARNKKLAFKYLANTLSIKIFLATITIILVDLTINLLGYPIQTIKVVYLIVFYVIFTSFIQTFYSIFQSFEKMEYQALSEILSNILMFTGVLVVIFLNLSIISFGFVYFISSLIILGFNFLLCSWKFILPKLEFDFEFWKKSLKNSLPFAITSIFVTIYFWIDSVMLSFMQGSNSVGIYNAAYNLILALMFIPSVFLLSMFPVMSKHFETSKNILKIEFEKSVKYLTIISIFILINGLVFSNKFVPLIYGNGYANSIQAFNVLIFVIPFLFLTILFGNFLGAINKQIIVTFVALINAIFNIILNIILIPKISYIGASTATVLTEASGFILMFIYITKFFFKVSIKNNLLKTILVGILLFVCISFINIYLNWIISFSIGVTIYLSFLYLLNILSTEDIKIFKKILRKN